MFFEFDENGVPLGAWTWDDATEMWIFDADVPLAYFPVAPLGAGAVAGMAAGLMPQTGLISFTSQFGWLFMLFFAVAAISLATLKPKSILKK